MARFWSLVAVLCVAFLAGCSARSLLDRIAPETVQQAKTNFDYLRHHQFDQVEPALDPSISRDTLQSNLAEMAGLVPRGEPVSVKTVGAYKNCDTRAGCRTQVTLEYQFQGKWLLMQLIVHSQDDKTVITAMDVQPESASLEEVNEFTLRGKTSLQYLILAAAIGSMPVMIDALILCVRTPMARRKWLWIIIILVGVGKVVVNWTTGDADYHIFWINAPPAGLVAQPYGPWFLSACVPLGAILFFINRKRLTKGEPPDPLKRELPSFEPSPESGPNTSVRVRHT
jgi:hypothetical protein